MPHEHLESLSPGPPVTLPQQDPNRWGALRAAGLGGTALTPWSEQLCSLSLWLQPPGQRRGLSLRSGPLEGSGLNRRGRRCEDVAMDPTLALTGAMRKADGEIEPPPSEGKSSSHTRVGIGPPGGLVNGAEPTLAPSVVLMWA